MIKGIGNHKPLVITAMERLHKAISGDDDKLAIEAIGIVIKLMPYVIEKESETPESVANNNLAGQIIVSNYRSFITDRLSKTNLGDLMLLPEYQVDNSVKIVSQSKN